MAEKKYMRTCIYCDEIYYTPHKHSKVCLDCKEQNHDEKVMGNLFVADVI